ncbi:MAG: hypothetical protein K8U03_20810 [Planctomycetia bacterium]|nr:hypothetical protein [Planctomycetia bacterium]
MMVSAMLKSFASLSCFSAAKPLGCVASACLLIAASGCYKPNEPAAKSGGSAAKQAHAHAEHAHPSAGPHKGALIELGKEEFHAELVHDDAAHKVTIYLLDDHAVGKVTTTETKLALNFVLDGKPQQFFLAALPQTDDAAGTTSRFEAVDPALCEAIDAPKNQGRFNVTIAGKSYSGTLAAEAHDHGHKH